MRSYSSATLSKQELREARKKSKQLRSLRKGSRTVETSKSEDGYGLGEKAHSGFENINYGGKEFWV